MNKKYLIAAAVVAVVAVFFYVAKSASGPKTSGSVQPAASPAQSAAPEKPQTEAPAVEINADSRKLIGVRTSEAQVKPITKVIRTVGRVEYDERKISTVNTKLEGWIERLHVNFTGRAVKKGEPLADIYSPELYVAQQELINALRWKKEGSTLHTQSSAGNTGGLRTDIGGMLARDAEAVIEAARQKLRLWDLTEAQIKAIEEAGKPVRTFVIYSPADGFVLQKTALQGMKVMAGEKLFDIVDLSSVWVIADIYEYDLPFVKEGQSAALGLSYFPGKEFSARVDYIFPALAAETKTARIRLTLRNPGGLLKPQMFTNVTLSAGLGSRLVVPEEAVIDTGLRQVVYVEQGEDNFEPREVSTGIRTDGLVEIIRGLKAGEKVASAANFLIDSEAQLKGIKPLPGSSPDQKPGSKK